MEGDALLEQLEDAVPHPAVAEGDPEGRQGLLVALVPADGLVEDRDAGLVPEHLAQEGRRVRRSGQGGAVASWAALKVRAKSAGATRRWIWKAALAASATMPGSSTSRVSGPSMTTRRSGFIGSRAADRAR